MFQSCCSLPEPPAEGGGGKPIAERTARLDIADDRGAPPDKNSPGRADSTSVALCSELGIEECGRILEEQGFGNDAGMRALENMTMGELKDELRAMGVKRGHAEILAQHFEKRSVHRQDALHSMKSLVSSSSVNSSGGSLERRAGRHSPVTHRHSSHDPAVLFKHVEHWSLEKKEKLNAQLYDLESVLEREQPDRWKIRWVLGSGGMSTVFEAKDKLLKRVALKVLFAGTPGSDTPFTETAAQQIRREATVMMRMNSEHICRCHGFYFSREMTLCWLVLELIPGNDLAALLHTNGPFLEYRAIQAGCAMLTALKEIHDAALVHRDIKPSNVMLGKRGDFKLIDLGLARKDLANDSSAPLEDDDDDGDMDTIWHTKAGGGHIAGTPHFMSPEQLQGVREDRRTDLWAVGVMLYQLVTGRLPFGVDEEGRPVDNLAKLSMDIERAATPPDVQAAIHHLNVQRNNKMNVGSRHGNKYKNSQDGVLFPVSDAFAAVVYKALYKDKTKRWFDASSMLDALSKALVPVSSHFFHIFISYRVASEKKLALLLYDELSRLQVGTEKTNIKVYLDQVALRDGQRWDEGFMDGLTRSLVFVPLVSAAACVKMCGLKESAPEGADNVLLEWATALFCIENDKSSLRAILPVFVSQDDGWGEEKGGGACFWNDGSMNVLNSLPKVVHEPTQETMQQHLTRAGLVESADSPSGTDAGAVGVAAGSKSKAKGKSADKAKKLPTMPTVHEVVQRLLKYQGEVMPNLHSAHDHPEHTQTQEHNLILNKLCGAICNCATKELMAATRLKGGSLSQSPGGADDELPSATRGSASSSSPPGANSTAKRCELDPEEAESIKRQCVELVAVWHADAGSAEKVQQGLIKALDRLDDSLFVSARASSETTRAVLIAVDEGLVELCIGVLETREHAPLHKQCFMLLSKVCKSHTGRVVPILLRGDFVHLILSFIKPGKRRRSKTTMLIEVDEGVEVEGEDDDDDEEGQPEQEKERVVVAAVEKEGGHPEQPPQLLTRRGTFRTAEGPPAPGQDKDEQVQAKIRILCVQLVSLIATTVVGARRIGLHDHQVIRCLLRFCSQHEERDLCYRAFRTIARLCKDRKCAIRLKEMGVVDLLMPHLLELEDTTKLAVGWEDGEEGKEEEEEEVESGRFDSMVLRSSSFKTLERQLSSRAEQLHGDKEDGIISDRFYIILQCMEDERIERLLNANFVAVYASVRAIMTHLRLTIGNRAGRNHYLVCLGKLLEHVDDDEQRESLSALMLPTLLDLLARFEENRSFGLFEYIGPERNIAVGLDVFGQRKLLAALWDLCEFGGGNASTLRAHAGALTAIQGLTLSEDDEIAVSAKGVLGLVLGNSADDNSGLTRPKITMSMVASTAERGSTQDFIRFLEDAGFEVQDAETDNAPTTCIVLCDDEYCADLNRRRLVQDMLRTDTAPLVVVMAIARPPAWLRRSANEVIDAAQLVQGADGLQAVVRELLALLSAKALEGLLDGV